MVGQNKLRDGESVVVHVKVKKTGSRAGDEVVQLYVAHQGSKVERPLQELKGFTRSSLKPGETKTVSLSFKSKTLAYWDETSHAFKIETDCVEVRVGGSSDRLPLHAIIAVAE